MDNMPPSFRRFSGISQAIAFAQDHAFRCTSADDPDGTAHTVAFAESLLRLQHECDAGTYRVRVVDDNDNTDLSWDESGDTARKLNSGEYVCVGVILEQCTTWTRTHPNDGRAGDTRHEWEQVDSVWQVIGTPEWCARQAQVYAADFLPME